MTIEKITILLLLTVLGSAFSQGCSSFNPDNLNECLQCGTGYYLTKGNCFPCPKTGSLKPECKTAAIPLVSSTLSTASVPNPADTVQVTTQVSSISVSSSQETTSTTETAKQTSTSSVSNKPVQNVQQSTIQNNSSTTVQPNTIPTLPTSSIPAPSSNNLLNQLIFTLLPPHCSQFKFVTQLQCSKCQAGYDLSSVKKCQLTTSNTTAPALPIDQKAATDTVIFKTDGSLPNINLAIPTATAEVRKNSFIPIQATLASQLINKSSQNIASPVTTTTTPTTTTPTATPTTTTPTTTTPTAPTSTITTPTATKPAAVTTSPATSTTPTTAAKPTTSAPIVIAQGIIPLDTTKASTNTANTTNTTNATNATNAINTTKSAPAVKMPKSSIIKDYNCMSSNSGFSFNAPISLANCRCIQCYNGFYYDLTQQICMPTNPLCKTSDNQNHCLTCYIGYVVSSGNCIMDDGKTTTNNQNTLSYTPAAVADPNCQKYYDNLTTCQTCANRFFLDTNTDVCMAIDTSCKTWNSTNGYCTSCYNGYSAGSSDRVCKPIIIPNVASSSTLNNKQFCKSTKNDVCTSCVYRYFLSNGFCLPVSDLCKTFNATFGFCNSCYDGYILSNGACEIPPAAIVNPDPNCSDYTELGCTTCLSNYFLNSQGWCQLVSSYCNGYNPANGFCLDCLSPYTLNQSTGECVYLN